MATKSKHPLSSFDPGLFDVLQQGSSKELKLRFPTSQAAIHCRHRLNSLRAAMRRENHSGWEQFYRAGVYMDPGDPTVLIVKPRDSEYRKVFEDAGVTLTDSAPAPAPALDTETATTVSIDQFLKDLHELK